MTRDHAAELFPIGTRVRYRTRTGSYSPVHRVRSEPWTLRPGETVIAVTGRSKCVPVDRLERPDVLKKITRGRMAY